MGLPGGAKSPLYPALEKACLATGDRLDLAKGKGNDADARGLVWVMDTADYPFHVAEPYHQVLVSHHLAMGAT